jgi:crotonyl-CoA carboxylase/reductase
MSEAANVITRPAGPAVKDLYDVGEIPPLGHVPAKMHAWAIRRERHGEPEKAMQLEVVPTPEVGHGSGRQLQRHLGRSR